MRVARLHIPGVVHHLIWRFVDRGWYFSSEVERARYLAWLGPALAESDWRCLSYALMSSHIHLAVVAGDMHLAEWSRRVNGPFAQWMNRRYERLGPLFADRPKDFAKSPGAVRELIAYIHNNPVHAGVVPIAEHSRWTSHRAYLGMERAPAWLHVDEGRDVFGGEDLRAAVAAAPAELATTDLRRIAHVARRHGALRVATPEGALVPLVARPFARVRPDPNRIIAIVCERYGLSAETLCSRRRSPTICEARAVAVHSARTLGLTGSDIAAKLGISPQAASKILRRTARNEDACGEVCERINREAVYPS